MANGKSASIEQNAAESEVDSFRKELGPFVVAAETTRMPMLFTNARETNKPIVFANDSFLELTGYRREEVLGQSFNFLAPGASAEALAAIESAFSDNPSNDPEICFSRRDQGKFWASLFVSPVHDENGQAVQHFVSLVNLTKHRQERDRLRLLLEELNHRTQNTLATVLAVAGQTLRGMADPGALSKFEGRILALSRTHSLLGAENWDKVSLRDILYSILDVFSASSNRVSIEGDDIRLLPKAALPLTMIFHELAANAVKYGALANGTGRISIAWSRDKEPPHELRVRWQESGGPPVTLPTHTGFGTRLIEKGLSHELNAEAFLHYQADGVVCELRLREGMANHG
jgi:PAS domain S-box-containing protein